MIFNKPWCNGVDLCTIVKENHAALHINSYSGYILDPVPFIEGVGIQEGSLHSVFMPWVSHPGEPSVWLPFLEGPGFPLLAPSPLSGLNAILF